AELVGSGGIVAGRTGSIEAAIELADYLVIGIEQGAAAAAPFGNAAKPLDGPEIRIRIVQVAEADAFEAAVRMVNAGQGFTLRRLIERPAQEEDARRRWVFQAEECEIGASRAGEAVGSAAGVRNVGNGRRRAVAGTGLVKPKELESRSNCLVLNAM